MIAGIEQGIEGREIAQLGSGNARANGDRGGTVPHQERFRTHRQPQAFGQDLAGLNVRIRRQHNEFLAAVAGQDVGLARVGFQPLGGLLEHVIAEEVAVVVVDGFEVVYVHQDDDQREPVPLGFLPKVL